MFKSNNGINPALLLSYERNSVQEQAHFGHVLLCDNSGLLLEIGDSGGNSFYYRSCQKPIQASFLVDEDLIGYYQLSGEEIAICCSSHAGQEKHISCIERLLKKINLSADNLKCPAHYPLSREARHNLIRKNIPPAPIHHNCSGKHVLMLMLCKKNCWDIETYDDFDHPAQKLIFQKLQELLGGCEIILSKDGCGLPAAAAPLENLAFAYLNMFMQPKYSKIREAFADFPYIIGGSGRLDSEIIFANRVLIAKVGAGGLCVVVNPQVKQALVVKITDASMPARAIVTIEALRQLGWLSNEQIAKNPLRELFNKDIIVSGGEIVGKAKCCFDMRL